MKTRIGFRKKSRSSSRKYSLTLLSLILSTLSAASTALAVPGDYDGDGKSDLAVALVDRTNGITDWVARGSSGSNVSFRFTVPGDALVSGVFFNDGKTYPGVVYVRDSRIPLEWHIKAPGGQEVQLNFCLPGDDIFNLADIDGDGRSDISCSRKSGRIQGYRSWYFAVSSMPGVVAEEVFGLNDDKPLMAYMDNSGRASMVALRGGFTWYSKKVWDTAVGQQQWGLPGDIPIVPQDMNGSGTASHIIVRPATATSDQTAYIRFPDGSITTDRLGLRTAIPLVGKFFDGFDFAWFQRDAGLVGVQTPNSAPDLVVPFGTKSNIIIRPDGTVIQPTDDARFQASASTPPSSGGGGSSDTGNGYSCTETVKVPDGGSNNKINANNSRRALKMIFKSSYAGRIDHVKSFTGGNFFDNFHSMGFEYGGRPWWNSDKKIDRYDAGSQYVIVAFLNDGGQACVFVKNPHVTVD